MGQVNLYKIDGNKKEDFLNKLSENLNSSENRITIRWITTKMCIL